MPIKHPVNSTETEMEVADSIEGESFPALVVVLEAENPMAGGARFSLTHAARVIVGRGDRREATRDQSGGAEILRVTAPSKFLSKEHARIDRTPSGWAVSDLDSKNGVYVNGELVQTRLLRNGDVIAIGRVFCMIENFPQEPGDLDLGDASSGASGALSLIPELMARLDRVPSEAKRDRSILIVGETGTGKEVMAKRIHVLSERTGLYVGVNCGAIAESILTAELFGHVKGAFTGAMTDRPGHLRMANHGTLLLDEIVSAPMPLQVALLRAMQEKEVHPIGAKRPESIDVRYIAAAQIPLDEAVAAGTFRRDLKGRFVQTFELPPLRERRIDIGLLVAAIMHELGITDRTLSFDAANRLLLHDWPENIRELRNTIDRWSGLAETGPIQPDDKPAIKRHDLPARAKVQPLDSTFAEQIQTCLRETEGDVQEASRRLGLGRTLLYHHMGRLKIDPKDFRKK